MHRVNNFPVAYMAAAFWQYSRKILANTHLPPLKEQAVKFLPVRQAKVFSPYSALKSKLPPLLVYEAVKKQGV